jgi:predicted transcriptional regulator of viral defense system
MDVFTKLAKLPIFTIDDLFALSGNTKTAYSQLSRLMKKGKVRKIRKKLYSVVNPQTDQLVASRYQIACAITDSAYISHHSAFEYYGLANQVFYEVTVSSKTKFNHFDYDQISYKYVASRSEEGVVSAKNITGVKLTDLERTVIDSIRDFNKIGGFEELLNCLKSLHALDEEKLKHYLEINNTQSLYQSVGYLLQHYQLELGLSKEFIELCKTKIGKSNRYLISDYKKGCHYEREWKLMVPRGLFQMSNLEEDTFLENE